MSAFATWMQALHQIAKSKGFQSAGPDELWRSEWKRGFTPQQAWERA